MKWWDRMPWSSFFECWVFTFIKKLFSSSSLSVIRVVPSITIIIYLSITNNILGIVLDAGYFIIGFLIYFFQQPHKVGTVVIVIIITINPIYQWRNWVQQVIFQVHTINKWHFCYCCLVNMLSPTLCEFMDCQASLSLGFSKPGILEWVAIFFTQRSSQPRDQTHISRIIGRFFSWWASGKILVNSKTRTWTRMYLITKLLNRYDISINR